MANLFTNNVQIMGNLTRDPELKHVTSGTAVCKFSIAINRRIKKNDEWTDAPPVFVDLVAWGKTGEWCGESLGKGCNVLIIGRLQSSEWQTQEGQKRKKLEVVVEHIQHNKKDEFYKVNKTPLPGEDEENIPF